jgi:hypothetical protein
MGKSKDKKGSRFRKKDEENCNQFEKLEQKAARLGKQIWEVTLTDSEDNEEEEEVEDIEEETELNDEDDLKENDEMDYKQEDEDILNKDPVNNGVIKITDKFDKIVIDEKKNVEYPIRTKHNDQIMKIINVIEHGEGGNKVIKFENTLVTYEYPKEVIEMPASSKKKKKIIEKDDSDKKKKKKKNEDSIQLDEEELQRLEEIRRKREEFAYLEKLKVEENLKLQEQKQKEKQNDKEKKDYKPKAKKKKGK